MTCRSDALDSAALVDPACKALQLKMVKPAFSGVFDQKLTWRPASGQLWFRADYYQVRAESIERSLAKITLDGRGLTVEGIREYNPTSLESARSQLAGMRNDGANTDHRLSNANSLVLLCLALNVVALVFLLLRRRRAP